MVGKLLLYEREHVLLVRRHPHYHLLLSPARRGLTQRRDLRDAADKGEQCSKDLTPNAECRSNMVMLPFVFVYCSKFFDDIFAAMFFIV